MAEIPIQSLVAAGVELTEGAAAAGDTAQVGNNKVLVVRNGSGASINVTLVVPGNDFTGTARPDMVVPVAAGKTKVIPLLNDYADSAIAGQVAVNYSATATVFRSVVAFY